MTVLTIHTVIMTVCIVSTVIGEEKVMVRLTFAKEGRIIASENDDYQTLFLHCYKTKQHGGGSNSSKLLAFFRQGSGPKRWRKAMKLVKRGESVVAIVEYLWENLHLKAQRVVMEWLQLFLTGKSAHMKEFDPERLQVRFCAGQELRDQKEVVFRAS